jgi:hypothetical protein
LPRRTTKNYKKLQKLQKTKKTYKKTTKNYKKNHQLKEGGIGARFETEKFRVRNSSATNCTMRFCAFWLSVTCFCHYAYGENNDKETGKEMEPEVKVQPSLAAVTAPLVNSAP